MENSHVMYFEVLTNAFGTHASLQVYSDAVEEGGRRLQLNECHWLGGKS